MKHQNKRLYVRQDIGKGQPIVLLHGMFADGTQWRVIAGLLADYYRVIVVDLLGHGKSPRPKSAMYTPAEHSSTLRYTLEQLKATKDATIVGYSMGGTVALQYAADYDDVAQLFMISTPFYLKPEEMVDAGYANSLFYTKFSVGLFRQVDKLLQPNKLLHKLVSKENLMKWLHVLIDAYDNKLDPEIMRLNLEKLIIDYPFAANLAKVTAPTTFYTGKRDVFVVRGQLQALKKIKPFMEIEALGIVKNDHMLVQYLPQQMVKVLTRYHDQTLHVAYDKGRGDVLVLLHGIESSSAYWKNYIDVLSKKRRVIAIDLLGFGKSPKPKNISYTLPEHVLWLKRTLENLDIRKFSIMGHSLGSLVALAYSSQFPQEVKKQYLISPVFYSQELEHKRFLMRKFKYFDYFSDESFLLSTINRAIGPRRLSAFTPTLRSMNHAVRQQNTIELVKKAARIPTEILYGKKDYLVDEALLQSISKYMKKLKVIAVDGGHNFPLTKPLEVLTRIDPELAKQKLARTTARPTNVLRELVKLAAPILLAKGFAFTIAGLLLFSDYKEETLVAGLSAMVMIQGAQFIRGSFSLKNEGLSYISYFSLGLFGILLGYLLTAQFDITLKVTLLIVCGFLLMNGISRFLAAVLWTADRPRRRRLLITGLTLILVSAATFLGSLISVYIVVYGLAAYLLIRGLTYIGYFYISIPAAYGRGF